MPEKTRPTTPSRSWPRAALLALPLLAGIVEAVRRAWLCDDIFISFRYVDHWARGFGLVFNPGERVEGYTHFLWVVLLAALHRLGFDLVTLGRWLPLVFWIGILAVLFARAQRAGMALPPRARSAWLALPVAAWGVALHRDSQLFASGGLETSLFALLLLLGLLLITASRPRWDLAAVVYALAVLVRPEGVLYAGLAGLYVLWRWRDVRQVARFALLWMLLVVPFVAWKTLYYGTPIPNTYYAKSAGMAYWSQGWAYTRLYFFVYAVLVVCFLVAAAAWIATARHEHGGTGDAQDARMRRGATSAPAPATPNRGLVLLALAQVLVTVLYVTRVGGDFMFARFFIPVTPLAYLAAEEAVRWLRSPGWMLLLAAAVVGLTLYARQPRSHLFVGCEKVQGIVDEPGCYTPDVVRDLRRQGEVLGRILGGTAARIVMPPGRNMVAWFGRLPYVVEGTGLTNVEIARAPVAQRGRPGHEKGPSDVWLREHGVQLRLLYGVHRTANLRTYEKIGFDDLFGQILFWDTELMEQLRERDGVAFVDFPQYLDQYVQWPLAQQPKPRLLDDYARFQRFYFQHNSDPQRLAALQAALHAAGVPAEGLRAAAGTAP